MYLRKADGLHKIQRSLKVLFGFACKADHYVGSDGGVVKRGSQAVDDRHILRAVIVAVHRLERSVTAALQRKMKLRTKLRLCRKTGDQRFRHLLRLERAETHAGDTLDRTSRLDRVRKVKVFTLTVGGKIDTDQHHLAVAAGREHLDLGFQLGERLGTHPSSGVGNDTVGTEAVAAVLDLDKGARVLAERGDRHRLKQRALILMYGNVEQSVSLNTKTLDRRYQLGTLLVAEDDVALGKTLHLLGKRLRHAARQHHDALRILAADAVDQLSVLRVADRGHGAAVDDGDVRVLLVLRRHIAVPQQVLTHRLGLVLIHLTPER